MMPACVSFSDLTGCSDDVLIGAKRSFPVALVEVRPPMTLSGRLRRPFAALDFRRTSDRRPPHVVLILAGRPHETAQFHEPSRRRTGIGRSRRARSNRRCR